MKYFLFLISFTKIKNLIFVFFLLSITTVLEYLFVFSVPFFFKIIFQEQTQFINYFNNFGFLEKSDIFKAILLLLILFFVVKNIFYFANQYFFLKYSFSIHNNLTRILFSKYLSSNYQIFINSESSLLLRNVISNTSIVRNLVLNITTFFSEVLVFMGLCAIIIYQSTLMSLFSIAFIIIFSVAYLYYSRHLSKNWALKIQDYEQSKIRSVQESFSGFKELKLLNKEKLFLNDFNSSNQKSNSLTLKFSLLYAFPRVYLEVVGAVGVVLLVLLNIDKTGQNTFASAIPMLSLYFVAFLRLLPSVNRILNSIEVHRFSFPVLKILYDDFIKLGNHSLEKNTYHLKFEKNLNFKNIKFSFLIQKQRKKIFNNLNLIIKSGEKIGIVGDNGAGKTTFVNLLSGLLVPNKGSILVDGKSIKNNIKNWQANIGYIYQSTFLMNDTIENNICFDEVKNHDHYLKIKKINTLIGFDKFLKNLPEGLNTIVGEGGAKLSGGQKQRIGIARALYFDRKILICDEITSSLDRNAEDSVIHCLKNIDKTIIIISHKIDNLRFCSKIYKIYDGKITLVKTR
jgi:ABC-type bacteriocin/lantibiotic exporter with double-glycine peptidase domain